MADADPGPTPPPAAVPIDAPIDAPIDVPIDAPIVAYYRYGDPLLDGGKSWTLEEGWGEIIPRGENALPVRLYQDLAQADRRAGSKAPTAASPSGSPKASPGDRPQWQKFLADCQTLNLQVLQVAQLEDLGETLEEVAQRIQALDRLGITVLTLKEDEAAIGAEAGLEGAVPGTDPATEPATDPASHAVPGSLNPSPPGSLSKAETLYLLQDLQRQQRSRKIRKGHARNRIQALPPPGRAPYGYRRGKDRYALDRTTAPVVKEFFEQFILYGSLRGSVRHIAKKYNKQISVSTGQRWLTNPVYRGDLCYKNGEVVADTHLAILSREEAAQIDRLLRRNRQLAPRTASAPRSLAGLVSCGRCQSATTIVHTTIRGKTKDYLYLRPTACTGQPKCKAIAYEPLLQQIIDRICQDLPQAVAGLDPTGLNQAKAGLQGAIAAKEQVLTQLPALEEQGILDGETVALRRYRLWTELAALRSQLAQLPPVNLKELAQTVAIPQFWLDLSESERRFFFREFLQGIELLPQESGTWEPQLRFIF